MSGNSDVVLRVAGLVKRYGAGLTVSEMIASQAMIRETRQSLQKAAWDPSEEPVSMQLAGCTPYEMAEAAKLNADRGAAIIDIMGGQVPIMNSSIAVVLPHVRSGKLKALGVSDTRRTHLLPNVPTIAEAGVPGYGAAGVSFTSSAPSASAAIQTPMTRPT